MFLQCQWMTFRKCLDNIPCPLGYFRMARVFGASNVIRGNKWDIPTTSNTNQQILIARRNYSNIMVLIAYKKRGPDNGWEALFQNKRIDCAWHRVRETPIRHAFAWNFLEVADELFQLIVRNMNETFWN